MTHVEASYATTLLFVGVMLGSPAYGLLSDRIGRRILPMIQGAVISLGVMLALLCIPSLSTFWIMTLFFLTGFVTSSQVLSFPLIAELNPPVLTSTAISVDSLSIMLSGAISQPAFGWIMALHAKTSAEGVMVYSASDFMRAMWIMPVAFVISIAITFFLRESFCRASVLPGIP